MLSKWTENKLFHLQVENTILERYCSGGHRTPFWGDEHALKLCSGDGCTALWLFQKSLNHIKLYIFMLCELYLIKILVIIATKPIEYLGINSIK